MIQIDLPRLRAICQDLGTAEAIAAPGRHLSESEATALLEQRLGALYILFSDGLRKDLAFIFWAAYEAQVFSS